MKADVKRDNRRSSKDSARSFGSVSHAAPSRLRCEPEQFKKGVTIIELMMATMLLGVIFASAFSLIGMGFIMIERAKDTTRVTQILQNEVDFLRTQSWTQLQALEGTEAVTPDALIVAGVESRYTVTRILTDFKTDQMELTITAVWTDNKGIAHTRTFYTLLTNEGLYDFHYRTI